MTILGKKKDAQEIKESEATNIIRFEEDKDYTYLLIKGGEHLAKWVKIKRKIQGISVSANCAINFKGI